MHFFDFLLLFGAKFVIKLHIHYAYRICMSTSARMRSNYSRYWRSKFAPGGQSSPSVHVRLRITIDHIDT